MKQSIKQKKYTTEVILISGIAAVISMYTYFAILTPITEKVEDIVITSFTAVQSWGVNDTTW